MKEKVKRVSFLLLFLVGEDLQQAFRHSYVIDAGAGTGGHVNTRAPFLGGGTLTMLRRHVMFFFGNALS